MLSDKESRNLIELLDSSNSHDRDLAKEILKAKNKTMSKQVRLLLCSIIFMIYCILCYNLVDLPESGLGSKAMMCIFGGLLLVINSIVFIEKGRK